MRRSFAACALLVFTGCFKFDEKLAACRTDAGVWICPIKDSGSELPAPPATAFQCLGEGGWCWEHPLPSGGRLRSVWSSGPTDLWVGTEHGLVMHRNSDGWRSTYLGRFLSVEALCGKNGVVYAGTSFTGGGATPQLFSIDPASGNAVPIAGSTDDISGMDCGDDRLWVAHTGGAWSVTYADQVLADVAVALTPDEVGVGVVSPGPGQVLLVTAPRSEMVPIQARVVDQTGAEQFVFVPDAGQRVNFQTGDIWMTGDGTVQVSFNGQQTGEIWARGATAWSRIWPALDDPSPQIYDGAKWGSGALAVGSNGLVVELSGDGGRTTRRDTFGNSYHSSVFGLPTGEAFVVGDPSCVLERARDGGWGVTNNCDRFLDFSIGLEVLAVSDDTFYRRNPDGGWAVLSQRSGLYGVWANPADGGRALLLDDALEYNGRQLTQFANARELVALDETRVVVLLEDGTALDTALTLDFDGGSFAFPLRPRMVVDPTTRTFWAMETGTANLWSSDTPGVWTQIDAGATAIIEDVSARAGRVWIASGDTLFVSQPGGAWSTIRRSGRVFSRVVGLDNQRAAVFEFSTGPAQIFEATGSTVDFPGFPFDPVFTEVRGNELWVLGSQEGLIRRTFAP